MDRVTEYFGSLIRETDGLLTQQNTMKALSWASDMFLGTNIVVDKFTCIPTTPASMSIILTPGQVYQLASQESTIWSSLPADNGHQIVKQGIMQDQDILGLTPPSQIGYSQTYLLEVQYADLDTSPILLPYYNAQNPSIPFSGPANSGQSQNTARLGIVAVQLKAGIAAPSGTQVPPAPDNGWAGLFTITVAYGQASVTVGNISTNPLAPFLQPGAKLPALPFSIQDSIWSYAHDTGSASHLVITLTPSPTVYVEGLTVYVKAANAPSGPSTLNVNGMGARNIVHADASVVVSQEWHSGAILNLIYDGTNFQLISVTSPATSSPGFLTVSFTITTVVTKIVGGIGCDFADLVVAMQWVAQYTITPAGQVVFQMGAGQFTYSEHVILNHPNLDRIVIVGATMLASPPLVAAGYTLSGYSSGQRSSDTALNLSLLRTCFATELRFTGGYSFIVSGAKMLYALDAILFTGDGTIGTGVYPFNQGVCLACSGSFFAPSVYTVGIASIGFGGSGFTITNSARVVVTTPVISLGHAASGVYVNPQCALQADLAVLACSNGIDGLTCDVASAAKFYANYLVAVNANNGCTATQAALTLSGAISAITSNGNWGIVSQKGSAMYLTVQASGNNLGPMQATYSSTGVLTGSTGLGGISPALNTVGNNNSYWNT